MATRERIRAKKKKVTARVAPQAPLDSELLSDDDNRTEQTNVTMETELDISGVPAADSAPKGSIISVKEAAGSQDRHGLPEDERSASQQSGKFRTSEIGTPEPTRGGRSNTPDTVSPKQALSPSSRSASPVPRTSSPLPGSRPTTPGSRPGTPSSSLLPFRRHNAVEPTDADVPSNAGSQVSLRSHQSRTAWADENENNELVAADSMERGGAKSPDASIISVSEAAKDQRVTNVEDTDVKSVRSNSSASLSPPSMKGEQQAYIPYEYARTCIAKIMDDMKRMKLSHINIVHNIELNYKAIEDETQGQFNIFVLNLRRTYKEKVYTFRQVIELHRDDLNRKQDYWDESLISLSERNKKLLNDKRALLIRNKVEFERLEREKEEAVKQLTHELDTVNFKMSAAEKEHVELMEKQRLEHVQVVEEKDKETKIVKDELESEKQEVIRLRELLAKMKEEARESTVIVAATAAPSVELEASQQSEPAPVVTAVRESSFTAQPKVIVTDLSKEEREKMEEERRLISEERAKMAESMRTMEAEIDKFQEDRKAFNEEKNKLQLEMNAANKEIIEWKTKYEMLRSQLGDLADIKAKYDALLAQFEVMAAMSKVDTEEDKKKAEETMAKTKEDRDMMEEEKQKIEEDIKKWEAEFKANNGRDPTEDDKDESVNEFYVMLNETQGMVDKLDTQLDTLESLKEGKVPEAPKVEVAPITIAEPEIRTVEVTVPDPAVVAALEQAQNELSELKIALTKSQEENSQAQEQISKLNSEISGKQADLSKLEVENKSLVEQLEEAAAKIKELEAKLALSAATTVAVAVEKTEAPQGVVGGIEPEVHQQMRSDYEEKLEKLNAQLKNVEKSKKAIEKDMKKLLKQMGKKKAAGDAESLKLLLEAVVKEAHTVNGEVKQAGTKVKKQLDEVSAESNKLQADHEQKKAAVEEWGRVFTEQNGKPPTEEDRDEKAFKLYTDLEMSGSCHRDNDLRVTALTMIHTGVVPEKYAPIPVQTGSGGEGNKDDIERLEKQVADLEDKVSDLESEVETLQESKKTSEEKITELEDKIQELQRQLSEAPSAGAAVALSLSASLDDDTEGLGDQLSELQKQIDRLEAELRAEQSAHEVTREELETLKQQLLIVNDKSQEEKAELERKLESAKSVTEAQVVKLEKELKTAKTEIEELEKAKFANAPVDTTKELKKLQEKIKSLEKQNSTMSSASITMTTEIKELKDKLNVTEKSVKNQAALVLAGEVKVKEAQKEKAMQIKKMEQEMAKKEEKRAAEEKKKVAVLEKKIKELQAAAGGAPSGGRPTTAGPKGPDAKSEAAIKQLKEQVEKLKKEGVELKNQNKTMDAELKKAKSELSSAGAQDKQAVKKHEKILKELEKKLELEKKKAEKNEENFKMKLEEATELEKELSSKKKELDKSKAELAELGVAAKEGVEAALKVKELEKEVKKLTEENKTLGENFNSERVLRKKYYNMVEDMKGKIRVYARARPLSGSEKDRGNYDILKSPDEYTIQVQSARGVKEFQFDRIFMPSNTQEDVFEDTYNLVQSAVDGYNVCIFAYGQTGSGKTFTMIGDREQKFPGIAPRAFDRIFSLLEANKSKFSFKVQCYMLELYNDKLLDLLAKPGSSSDEKLDIKKDKKGMVVINGAEIKDAHNSKELYALFDSGSANRHVASTKMNAESSRSHLVIGVIMETTNKTSGAVMRGKLSLVDLAGSERVGKTGATAEQLKEANSINKSLSALGDVISALSNGESFIPYRNNKLTMLMQDSLGGNAKTLMFVNISPADYNADETAISLLYASRVKCITNDASKNSDNKEIARLKSVIAKLKSGEAVEEEV